MGRVGLWNLGVSITYGHTKGGPNILENMHTLVHLYMAAIVSYGGGCSLYVYQKNPEQEQPNWPEIFREKNWP